MKNGRSASNARPRKIAITHGGSSAALRFGMLDGRTRLAKAERRLIKGLVHDLGREPTAMETALFRSVARLDIIAGIARAEVERSGMVTSAADALVKASRELLALAESDQFTGLFAVNKPDNNALVAAQREALKELSDAALRALYWRHYGGPEPVKPAPVLLLPPPKRPRIEPRRPKPAPAPAPATAPARPRIKPEIEQGGPGYRVVRPPDVEVITDGEPGSVIDRPGSPWRM